MRSDAPSDGGYQRLGAAVCIKAPRLKLERRMPCHAFGALGTSASQKKHSDQRRGAVAGSNQRCHDRDQPHARAWRHGRHARGARRSFQTGAARPDVARQLVICAHAGLGGRVWAVTPPKMRAFRRPVWRGHDALRRCETRHHRVFSGDLLQRRCGSTRAALFEAESDKLWHVIAHADNPLVIT